MQRARFILDERSKRKFEETSMVVLILFFYVCPIEMVIKIAVTHNPLSVLGELFIFFSILAVFLVVRRLNKNYSPVLPRKSSGEPLSTEKSKTAKRKRMLVYAKESLLSAIVFRIVWVTLDYFLKKQDMIWRFSFFVNQLISLIIIFLVFFIVYTLVKERQIKAYNRSNEKLDKQG